MRKNKSGLHTDVPAIFDGVKNKSGLRTDVPAIFDGVKYKSGLHTDVRAIFDGVWNPETDNIQQSFDAPAASAVAPFDPAPQAVYHWPQKHGSAGFFSAWKDASAFIFRSRARRERRRLSSISRHLMINIPS